MMWGLGAALALIAAHQWVLTAVDQQRQRLDGMQLAVGQASRDAAGLLVLTQDFLLHRGSRARRQWQAVHQELKQALQAADVRPSPLVESEVSDDLADLLSVTAGLPPLFAALGEEVDAGASQAEPSARMDMLADHLLAEIRRISDGAFDLAGRLVDRRQQLRRDARLLSLLSNLALAGLLLALMAVVLRRVLRPMNRLEHAAGRMADGDLQARSGYYANDEFGRLSQRFDAMAQSLQDRQATLAAAQGDLQRANDRFELAVAAAGLGVWEWDVVTNTLLWDEHMYALYGRSRADGVQPYTLWLDSLHPEDRVDSEVALFDAVEGRRAFETSFRIVHPDGQVRQLRAVARVVRDGEGRALRMIGVNTDETDALRADSALRASESLLSRVGRLASVGAWRVDVPTARLHWAAQTFAIHEVAPDYEPSLTSALDFYAPESRPLISAAIERGIHAGEGWDLELRLITAKGRPIWVRAMGEVEFDAGGAPRQLVGAIQDITARRETDDKLRAASAAAEAASAAKSAFLANMSHEIRTPLNAIIGVGHLLSDTALDAEQRHLVGQAQLAGQSLLGIVNDVLDLAKIEAGEMALDTAVYEPAQMLHDLEVVYALQAQAKGLRCRFEAEPDLPPALFGDRARLLQMLTNLLSNAIKFTAHGEVGVRLGLDRTDPARCRLRATVHDTGIGIPEHLQQQLFVEFVQADVSTTRRFGGTGLGLSIVKRLAALMDGEVQLHSVAGVGSDIGFVVTQRLPAEHELAQQLEQRASTLEVAVVDDSSVDRQGLAALVRSLGWLATAHPSGTALLDDLQLRRSSGRAMPDVLLVDWHMPDMDGLQAVDELARRTGGADLPAILVVSISDRSEVLARAEATWVDHVLSKPVPLAVLYNAVRDSLARRAVPGVGGVPSAAGAADDPAALAGLRLLLVDDSDINLEVGRRLLERRGAQVQASNGGQAALELLRAAPRAFDAVLMDVQMPGIDGLEATRMIRRELGLHDLPIIALTAGALTEERRRAIDAGMNEFLTKPLAPTLLVRTLRRLIRPGGAAAGGPDAGGTALASGLALQAPQDPQARRPQVGTGPTTAAPQDAGCAPIALPDAHRPAPGWPQIAGIDTAAVSERLGQDLDLFRSLLAQLLDDAADVVQAADTTGPASVAERRGRLASRVHKLRGGASMLGVDSLQLVAGEVEEQLRRADGDPAKVLLPLAQEHARLARACQALLAVDSTPGDPADAEAGTGVAGGQELSAGTTRRPTDPTSAQLVALRELLTQRDLSAHAALQRLRPALAASLGPDATQRLVRAVERLDFEQALNELAALPTTP
ncbi:MAG: hypothetical protein RIQ60_4155 [Pseudomonadota bacterium]|jgi:signal transduction histidine kinase/DNA-binding response OmpR family regulator/HAMP domain-containing protein/HPt (histidine-containing phosphotransfer) domain-containing protein